MFINSYVKYEAECRTMSSQGKKRLNAVRFSSTEGIDSAIDRTDDR